MHIVNGLGVIAVVWLTSCASEGISEDSEQLYFSSDGSSHRGIHRFKRLRQVWLYRVNQSFLEEIAQLSHLESIHIDRNTATDLTCLKRLPRLRRLVIHGGTKIENLDWVSELASLEILAIENFKRVTRLDALASQTSLTALALEGSMWTRMSVASLRPISGLLKLRWLFLTNFAARDRSLRALYLLRKLEVLGTAAFYPDEEFIRLRRALPGLRCDWFSFIDNHGGIRKGIKTMVESARNNPPPPLP